MDALKLFTVEEVRNLLVKWWGFYKTRDADINTRDKFMVLAYKKTFEMVCLATLNGENDIDYIVEAIENGSIADILVNLNQDILTKYPVQDNFVRAMESMLLRLYSIPFSSEPLFKNTR